VIHAAKRGFTSRIFDTSFFEPHKPTMKKNTCSLIAAMLLGIALVFTGCATPLSDDTASIEKNKSDLVILREGDLLKISFPGSPNLDASQQIRRDGKITLSLVGEVEAAGLTPDTLQKKLIELYASQISSKEINVALQTSTFPVFVTGAVVRPGKVQSDHPITALEAVMEAGGFDLTAANLKAVKIIRNENGVLKNYQINLKDVLDGKSDKSFYLKPGDIVYVPERFQMF
jgi:polysaccharide biosynthesis/export protein